MSQVCFECGGLLEPKCAEGRTYLGDVLPSDLPLPTCADCGSDFVIDEVEEVLTSKTGDTVFEDIEPLTIRDHMHILKRYSPNRAVRERSVEDILTEFGL